MLVFERRGLRSSIEGRIADQVKQSRIITDAMSSGQNVFGENAYAIELIRRSSLFPMSCRRQAKRIVPSAPILVRYLTRDSARAPRVLCTVPDRRTRRGCH